MTNRISFFKKQVIVEVIVAAYVLLFMYAGLSKLFVLEGFGRRIEATLHTTPVMGKVIGVGLIAAEILTALSFFKTKHRLRSLYSSLILMMMFTLYIICILSFSSHLPCSCGGILQNMSWSVHIVFNIAFILMAILGIILEKRRDDFVMAGVER